MNIFRSHTIRLLFAAALLVPAACNTSPDARSFPHDRTAEVGTGCNHDVEPELRLTVGDRLQIADAYNDALGLDMPVDPDGTVFLPKLGAVLLAGRTRTEIETLLTEKYGPYFERLDIKVRIYDGPMQYFVVGEVVKEGAQPFDGDVTVFEAVTRAEPRQHSANLGRVRVIRATPRDPLVQTIDLQRIVQTGDTSCNVHIEAGDIIQVPSKPSANLGRVRLIRADPRDPLVQPVDLQRIIETGDTSCNVHIEAGDIIQVPTPTPAPAAEPKR